MTTDAFVDAGIGLAQAGFETKPKEFRVIHDIAEATRTDEETKTLLGRLHYYFSMSPTITYSFRIEDGRSIWQWISENVERILGYTPIEALAPDWWLSCVYPDDRKDVIRGLADLVRSKSLEREYRFMTKSRKTVWIRDELRVFRDEAGAAEVVGTLTDVSAGKKGEEELALKSAALEAAANAMVITDREGLIRWVNPAFELLSGYSREEAEGKNPRDLVKSGKQETAFYRDMWTTILEGKVWRGSMVNRRKSGETYTEEMTITPVFDKDRRIVEFVAIKSDVTERELARVRLEAAGREKDALLREVHHRVNDNMQLISSLLNLEPADGSAAKAMSDIERRVQSIAIIHKQFYESKDLSRIDFSRALPDIVDAIREEGLGRASPLSVVFDVKEALLEIDEAIPAGLIVAELVSSVFRRASLVASMAGSMLVTLRLLDHGRLEIVLRTEGIGLPDDFDFSGGDSLGKVLIEGLVTQLHGDIRIASGSVATATLRFPGSRDRADTREQPAGPGS